MTENTDMKLSSESDGKMNKKAKPTNSTHEQIQDKKEFFNTTQNSE